MTAQVKLTAIEVNKQDDGLWQVAATYSNGKVKTWSDFETSAAAYECLNATEFMASTGK